MPTARILTSIYTPAVLVLLVLIAFYSLYKLSESPPTWYDEGIYIQVAHSLEHSGAQSLQMAPGEVISTQFVTGGYPFLAPVALSMKLFGDSLFVARLPMVLYILLFAGAAWALIYRVSGRCSALFSLLLLATFPLLYGNGKNVLGEVPGLLYTALALLSLWRLESKQFAGGWNYAALGLAVGLAAATKPVFLLLPLGIALVLLFHIRSVPLRWKEISTGALAFLTPMALWAYLQFGSGISFSAILSYYLNPYGVESVASTVLQNFMRFFTEATPLYCGGLMALWLLSFLLRFYRKEKISLAEQSALAFSALILLAYVRTAGWYRYFFEAMTFALIFAPHALQVVARAMGEYWPRFKKYLAFAPALLLLLALVQFYQLNFSSWVAEHYGSSYTKSVTAFFATYGKDKTFFVYNTPDIVVFLPTDKYYQYLAPTEAIQYGAQNLPLLARGVPDAVVLAGSEYATHPALFRQYKKVGEPGPYVVLERK